MRYYCMWNKLSETPRSQKTKKSIKRSRSCRSNTHNQTLNKTLEKVDFLSICSRASLSHACCRCSTISNLLLRARALRQIIRGRGGAALGTNWTTCRAVSHDRLAFIPFAMELPGGTATSCHTAHLTGRLVLAGHAGPLTDQLRQE